MGDIVNLVTDSTEDFEDKSPTPEMVTLPFLHFRLSNWVNR